MRDYKKQTADEKVWGELKVMNKIKGAPRYLLLVLEAVVQLAVRQNHFPATLVLASAICAQHWQLNLVMPPVEKQSFAEAAATARQQLSKEVAAIAWATGAAITLDEAVAYALTKGTTA